eukprot:13210913-Alexandrium_andersonii.AAC.1
MLRACSACLCGLGGHSAGWWAGAVFRRGPSFVGLRRLVRNLCLFFPLPCAYRPFGPLRFELCARPDRPAPKTISFSWLHREGA